KTTWSAPSSADAPPGSGVPGAAAASGPPAAASAPGDGRADRHSLEGMEASRRNLLAAVAAAVVLVGGGIVAVVAAGPSSIEPVADAAPAQPGAPSVDGEWEPITTTTA